MSPVQILKIESKEIKIMITTRNTQPQNSDAKSITNPQTTTKIKNLIFDLGHVFIRIDKSRLTVFKAFSQLTQRYGKALTVEAVAQIFNDAKTDAEVINFHRGKLKPSQFRENIKNKLGISKASDSEFDKAWCASVLGHPNIVKLRLEYLKKLNALGYKIFLLSNNNEIHRINCNIHYSGVHWGQYFLKQYYSDITGNYKPSAMSWNQILTENNLLAAETMFFDDTPKIIKASWDVKIPARVFTVNRVMEDVPLMIDAVNKAYERGIKADSLNTLSLFAINKFRQNVQNKKQAHTRINLKKKIDEFQSELEIIKKAEGNFSLLKPLALKGNGQALFKLACCYRDGKGDEKDKEVRQYLEKEHGVQVDKPFDFALELFHLSRNKRRDLLKQWLEKQPGPCEMSVTVQNASFNR